MYMFIYIMIDDEDTATVAAAADWQLLKTVKRIDASNKWNSIEFKLQAQNWCSFGLDSFGFYWYDDLIRTQNGSY